MSKIRVRSYLDGNAPQFNAAEKNGIIPFMKAMFEQESYGNIIPIGHQIDLVNNQLILEFDHNPGYSAGNLVQIVGFGLRSFAEDYFRVIANDGARLYLRYDFNTLDPIPVDFDSTSLVVRHAPMDWEVLYSTDTQFSLRSKNEKSSKNVVTFKTPQGDSYQTSALLYASFFHVSKDVSTTTGEIIEDYFQKDIEGFTNNTESPFFVRTSANVYSYGHALSLTNTTVKYPWYLVGDDRFFYLIIGNTYNHGNNNWLHMNFNRDPSVQHTYRSVYFFGDPDRILQDDPEDPTGFIYSTNYRNPVTIYSEIKNSSENSQLGFRKDFNLTMNNPYPRNLQDAPCGFLRDYNNLTGSTCPANLHTMSFNGASSVSSFSYPGPFSHGIYFFPIYTSVMYNNTNNQYLNNTSSYLRSKLPWAVKPFQSLINITNTWTDLDYSVIKAQGNDVLNIVTSASTSTLVNSVSFVLD